MQSANLDFERGGYPPIAFWQEQVNMDGQYLRMVKEEENGNAGVALFGIGFCNWQQRGRHDCP